jgi:hypothetical protein
MKSLVLCSMLALTCCGKKVDPPTVRSDNNGHNNVPGVFLITMYAPDGKTILQSRARSYSYNVGWLQYENESGKAVVTNAIYTIEHQ